MRNSALGALAVCALCLASISCDNPKLLSPTEPPPPPADVDGAALVWFGQLRLPSCLGDGPCEFEGEARNDGAGCAAGVRGVTRLFDDDARLLQSAEWALDTNRILRPGESFVYQGCCFAKAAFDDAKSYLTQIAWDDVDC